MALDAEIFARATGDMGPVREASELALSGIRPTTEPVHRERTVAQPVDGVALQAPSGLRGFSQLLESISRCLGGGRLACLLLAQ